MNCTTRLVALTSSLVLAAGIFVPAQVALADVDATSTTSTSSSVGAAVSAHSAGTKPVGQTTYTWGSTRGVPAGSKIVTQVLLNGEWATSQQSTVRSDGTFTIELTYGKHQAATYKWRVLATPAGQPAVPSNTFALTRTAQRAVSAATAGTKPVGQDTYGWGRVSGIPAGAHIESQVKVAGSWARSQISTVRSDGTFAIPLTYGKNTPGTYVWRFVARHSGVATASPEATLQRIGSDVARDASIRAYSAGTKTVGAATYAWGTTSGIGAGTRIETQVRIGDRWSRSQVSDVKADGSFVLPLTYGADTVGKYTYRVVVHGDGVSIVSNQFVLTRVAPASSSTPTQTVAPSGFPNATNSGVPAGTTLRRSGSIVVTTPGTVIDGLDVDGSIDIQADNVTIRNSRVSTGAARYPIRVHPGVTGALIERVEVSNEGGDGKGIYFNSGSGTVRYSNIHSAEDGIFITADNVVVEHNYVHHLMRNAGAHPDAIQIRGGDNVTIRYNNLQAIHPDTGVSNAAIQIGSLVGDTITDLRVYGNLMNGGRFTINGGGRGEVDSAVYSGNRFGRDHQYGVQGNLQNSVWETSNVYHDNGQPAR